MNDHRKRLPGERNPEPDAAAVAHVVREGQMANGRGSGDFGIARGVFAFIDWRKRRKAVKSRRRG